MDERLAASGWRARAAQVFTRVEDIVYLGLGLLLAASALVLLCLEIISFGHNLITGDLSGRIVEVVDRILLILMIVEILYTVQVSFREHTLTPEPFLIVGLIAATRRILVLTAEFAKMLQQGEGAFRYSIVELGLLTVLIVALVVSLRLLRERHPDATARRS